MSHEIGRLDNIGLALTPAWHGLGKVFDRVMTTRDILAETSVGGYRVVQARGFVPYYLDTGCPINADKISAGPMSIWDKIGWRPTDALFNFRDDVRADTPEALLSPTGVGEGYVVVQNEELCAVADTVLGETGAVYESAGTLRNGALVWLLARIPQDTIVGGSDHVRRYMLIYSAHDGTRSITVASTHVRVVCWNTLSAALGENSNKVELRHTSGVKAAIADAIRACKLSRDAFERERQLYNSMSAKAVSDRFVVAYLRALYPDPVNAKSTTRAENKRADIFGLLRTQPGHNDPALRTPDGLPTQYALYNAVTHYWQHESTSRMERMEGESELDRVRRRAGERMRQNMLGGSQELQRTAALELLCRADELESSGRSAEALALVAN